MDNIILIGMPGSGKSSVGVVLAKTLGYDFLDVDLLIQQQQGALLQELLDEKGVEWFLDAEADAIASVHCHHTVIAPGGSCICRERAIEHMRSLGTVVYLQLTLEEVCRENLIGRSRPPARPDPSRRLRLPYPPLRDLRPSHRPRTRPEPGGDGDRRATGFDAI